MHRLWQQIQVMRNRPVFLAFFLQLMAFALQVMFWGVWVRWQHPWQYSWHVTLFELLAIQSILAVCLSWWSGMAVWWWGIQAILPFAVAGAWHLPSVWFAGGFVLLALAYWHTFRTQVPYYPSDRAMWVQLATVLSPRVAQAQDCRMADIGSGLGGLALYLASTFPACDVVGVELSPLPWLWAFLRTRWLRRRGNFERVHFVRGDYQDMDFAAYDVVVAYLSPAAMPALWTKAKQEMRAGSVLFSYEFDIPEQPAHQIFRTQTMREALYAWYI